MTRLVRPREPSLVCRLPRPRPSRLGSLASGLHFSPHRAYSWIVSRPRSRTDRSSSQGENPDDRGSPASRVVAREERQKEEENELPVKLLA